MWTAVPVSHLLALNVLVESTIQFDNGIDIGGQLWHFCNLDRPFVDNDSRTFPGQLCQIYDMHTDPV